MGTCQEDTTYGEDTNSELATSILNNKDKDAQKAL
jgi:hypothetical protein